MPNPLATRTVIALLLAALGLLFVAGEVEGAGAPVDVVEFAHTYVMVLVFKSLRKAWVIAPPSVVVFKN